MVSISLLKLIKFFTVLCCNLIKFTQRYRDAIRSLTCRVRGCITRHMVLIISKQLILLPFICRLMLK